MILKIFWFSNKHINTVTGMLQFCDTCTSLLCLLGPYGEQDDQQVFIQKVVPETNQLFIRLSSNGQR